MEVLAAEEVVALSWLFLCLEEERGSLAKPLRLGQSGLLLPILLVRVVRLPPRVLLQCGVLLPTIHDEFLLLHCKFASGFEAWVVYQVDDFAGAAVQIQVNDFLESDLFGHLLAMSDYVVAAGCSQILLDLDLHAVWALEAFAAGWNIAGAAHCIENYFPIASVWEA